MAECTETEKKCISFIWKIEKFSEHFQNGIESPILHLPELGGTRFKLLISVHACKTFSISLQREDLKDAPIQLDIEILLLLGNSTPISLETVKAMTFLKGNTYCSKSFPIRDDMIEWNASLHLPKDKFTLCYRIRPCGKDLAEPIRVVVVTQIGVVRTISLDWASFKWSFYSNERFYLNQSLNCEEKMRKKEAFITANFLHKRKTLRLRLYNVGFSKINSVLMEALVLNQNGEVVQLGEKESLVPADANSFSSSIEFLNQDIESIISGIKPLRVNIYLKGIVSNEIKEVSYGFTIPEYSFDVEPLFQTGFSTSFQSHQDSHDIQQSDIYQSSKGIFQSLYENSVNCDCVLQAGDQMFPVHKAVLSARSPVFKTMFENYEKETNKTIKLPSIDPHTLCQMVRFIYSDEVHDLEMESASKLYMAADSYQLPELKQICFSSFKSSLSVVSVCEGLLAADKLQNNDLKSAVVDFLLDHNEIISSDKWSEFKGSYPKLAADTLQTMFERFRCNRKET